MLNIIAKLFYHIKMNKLNTNVLPSLSGILSVFNNIIKYREPDWNVIKIKIILWRLDTIILKNCLSSYIIPLLSYWSFIVRFAITMEFFNVLTKILKSCIWIPSYVNIKSQEAFPNDHSQLHQRSRK